MRGRQLVAILIAGCAISAIGGYWVGFRDAWRLGAAAETLPTGVLASEQLEMLRAGQTNAVTKLLESDVDRGLVFGFDVVNHPMRDLWKPMWGIDVFPKYEQYASRLADYRVSHPSQAKLEALPEAPKEALESVGATVRQDLSKRDNMIERYATKR